MTGRILLGLALLGLAGCSRGKAGSKQPSDPNLLSAEAFCRSIFEAPTRQLEARCSAEEKTGGEYRRLADVALRPVAACVTALEPGVSENRVKLDKAKAEACAHALETAPWKSTLRVRDVKMYPECKGLATGMQGEKAACRTSLECQANLWCTGASFEHDGTCQPRGVEKSVCDAPILFAFDELDASCGSDLACNVGPFLPRYALGDTPLLSIQLELERGKERASSPSGTPSYGMAGLLRGSGGAVAGEGLGFGSVGASTKPTEQALASGGASDGPRVSLGTASITGGLPPDAVERLLRKNVAKLRACYQDGLRKDPKLAGRVVLRFEIAVDGSVGKLENSNEGLPAPVVQCLTRSIRQVAFPTPDTPTKVTLPLVLASGDTAPAPEPSSPPPVAPEDDSHLPLTCVRRSSSGEACASDRVCRSGLVCRAGQCATPGKPGDACESDLECQAGSFCSAKGSCAPLGASGTACTHSSQCRGACLDRKCSSFCGAG